jgi:hypothetical protein
MRDHEALQPVERIRLLSMIERQNLRRRRFRRCVGEFLAVGKDLPKLDIGVKVAEQGVRRRRLLEGQRRLDEEENEANERRADVHAGRAPSVTRLAARSRRAQASAAS